MGLFFCPLAFTSRGDNVANSKRQELAALIRKALPQLKREAYVADYAPHATDAEVVGLLLATLFDWHGLDIMRAAASGLEDANFHHEAGILFDLIKKEEGGL